LKSGELSAAAEKLKPEKETSEMNVIYNDSNSKNQEKLKK
jgi:hypothetical protein